MPDIAAICLPVRPGMLMMILDTSDELLRSLWGPKRDRREKKGERKRK